MHESVCVRTRIQYVCVGKGCVTVWLSDISVVRACEVSVSLKVIC